VFGPILDMPQLGNESGVTPVTTVCTSGARPLCMRIFSQEHGMSKDKATSGSILMAEMRRKERLLAPARWNISPAAELLGRPSYAPISTVACRCRIGYVFTVSQVSFQSLFWR
jgi:hypothetical protein